MLPQKNSKTALPSRSFLVPENRLFVTKPVQSVLGTNSTPKLGAPVTSFGNLLGFALKKNLSASQPNLPPSSSSERPYARRARCAESPEKEKVDRLHPPLRRLTQTRDLYDGLKSEPLKPLSDECVKRNNTKSRNDAPVVWSAQTSGRGSFVSEDWRRRSQHAVAQDTIVGNVNEDTKIAPPDPSLQMISVDHTSFNMKKGINPMPGEISTNFIRLNMKRKGGSYKSKQPNRDVRANPAAMARRDAKTHEFDKSSINNSDEESTPSLSMSAATDRGGLASLGLDPMFIALEALEGTESDAAPRRQPRDQNLRDGLIVNPTPDAAHPVFKVSSSAMICKEICSKRNSVKKKSDKVFNEVKFKRGARIKTMKSTGCIEDEWLEKLAPKCSGHQMPASLLVVKKTGPNKGRRFYGCGFPREEQCKFFLWAEDNPELLQLIATEIADEPDIKDTAEKWRQFALLSYHERLSNLDMAQLKREAKIAQARCRYIEQHYGSEQKHSKKIGLSGTKAEITARLTEEALDFLVLESILYEDPLNKRAVVEEDNEFCQEFDDDASIVSSCSTDSSPTNSPKRQCVEREILIFEGAKTEKSRLSKPSGITNSYLPDNNANEAVYLSDSDQNDVLSGSDSDCVEVQSIINNNIIARVLDCTQGAERKRMNVDTVRLLCFGYDSFRTGQRWAIDRVLQSQRSLLILPTGGGKSLCFFLPAVILGGGICAFSSDSSGLTIVVSPLISLMEDQLTKLPVFAPGACFSGCNSTVEVSRLTQAILNGFIKVLFVSPERLCTPSFRHLMQKLKRNRPIACVCVDEAHCLSQWSFNFRPSFLRIKRELKYIEPQAVIALTATATPDVEMEILEHLSIPAGIGVQRSPAKRYNLIVNANILNDRDEKNEAILAILKDKNFPGDLTSKSKKSLGSTIIYVWRRYETEVLVEYLKSCGISASAYHAGMDAQQRKRTQELFNRGSIDVIVATIAFGMGVDKPNVRSVVHAVIPRSVENYVQEIGRAGRDGQVSKCFLLINSADTISQYSMSHGPRLSDLQIFLVLRKIFESLSSRLFSLDSSPHSSADETSRGIESFLDSFFCCGHSVSVAVSSKELEQELDISEATTETILAILELSPFEFFEVESTRFDTISGRFRNHSSTDSIDISDSFIRMMLDLNQLKIEGRSKAPESRPVDKFGFSKSNTWDFVDIENATERRESYCGVEFRLSLLELANRLQVDPDNAARRLYMMRKSNIFSYSLTDSKIYVNILKKGLASSLMRWFAKNSPDYIMTLELFLKWLWFVAEKVNELLVTNVRCAATRVLDMWRMGNIIAAMTGSDPGLDSPSVYTSQDSVCEVNSSLKNMDPDARQRILTDFICDYYIGNLAPRRYADRKPINCILTDHSVFLKEIERLFYHVQLPIYVIDGPDDALNSKRFYESGDRNSVNIEYTGARIPSANMVKLFYNDVESLNCDPRLDDIVKSVSLSHKLPISNSTQLRFSFLWLKSLYVAKILHGLASHWLSQQDWASTGLWAKYANFHFDCIVRSVNTCLVMQVK